MKDGGVYARIEYLPGESISLGDIVKHIRTEVHKRGGFPSWLGGFKKGDVWEVQGEPWLVVRLVDPNIPVGSEP